jgi:hypothetical protein
LPDWQAGFGVGRRPRGHWCVYAYASAEMKRRRRRDRRFVWPQTDTMTRVVTAVEREKGGDGR